MSDRQQQYEELTMIRVFRLFSSLEYPQHLFVILEHSSIPVSMVRIVRSVIFRWSTAIGAI